MRKLLKNLGSESSPTHGLDGAVLGRGVKSPLLSGSEGVEALKIGECEVGAVVECGVVVVLVQSVLIQVPSVSIVEDLSG